jgi:hypothetical protein
MSDRAGKATAEAARQADYADDGTVVSRELRFEAAA